MYKYSFCDRVLEVGSALFMGQYFFLVWKCMLGTFINCQLCCANYIFVDCATISKSLCDI